MAAAVLAMTGFVSCGNVASEEKTNDVDSVEVVVDTLATDSVNEDVVVPAENAEVVEEEVAE